MRDVAQQLQNLGDAPDTVAANLAALGTTGKRKTPGCCPVANYLKDLGHQDVQVDADLDDQLVAYVEGAGWDLPGSVAEFVARFDDGEYPQLDAALVGQWGHQRAPGGEA